MNKQFSLRKIQRKCKVAILYPIITIGVHREIMERQHEENRRKRFFPTVSLGSLIAALAFIATGVGVYNQVIAEVNKSKIEIDNLKINELKRESEMKESRQEIKQDIRDVKSDVKDLNQKLDKVLTEVMKKNERR